MTWFLILKRSKFNFPMMKEAVRRSVEELDGKSIDTKDLQKMIAKHYTEIVKKYGNASERAQLIRLRNLNSVKSFIKLIRNYGYERKQKAGLMGNTSPSGLGNKSPLMSTTIWELKESEES